MIKKKIARTLEEAEELEDLNAGYESFAASLITQGNHRFYTLSMPSDVLVFTCTVDRRHEDPIEGFQRYLDERRAKGIAEYINSGLGTIPTSIVVSAQESAQMKYSSSKRTLQFKKVPGALLILDGQHRVYGFHRAQTRIRVPVVIYNGLKRAEEAQLFMDINTKQRPVPNELLLDIKKLADAETDAEAMLGEIFDLFDKRPASPLLGLTSPAERKRGKISRVTFNAALKPVFSTLKGSDAKHAYGVLAAYFHSWLAALRTRKVEGRITNPTLFRAVVALFPQIAERVSDRYDEYSVENFSEIIDPFVARIKKADLDTPGTSYITLYDKFRISLRRGFSIGPGGRG